MTVELINTGAELLLGRTLNRHQQWLCRRLSDLGYDVIRQVTVADVAGAICDAVRESLARADVVITTGGLGPTSDDLTRQSVAAMLGRPLHPDPAVLAHLQALFQRLNRSMPDRVRVQALVPEGAEVLPNAVGTAPGLALVLEPKPCRAGQRHSLLIMLPGPPRELHPMFDGSVVPLLARVLGQTEPYVCRTLRTTGVPESSVEERIAAALAPMVQQGLDLGYCARPGEVDVRLSARGSRAHALVSGAFEVVREALSSFIYTDQEEELEQALIRLLTERRLTLALAESCSGGLIAHRLTDVPGASQVFLAGMVTYSNAAKHEWLGVSETLLREHGAVSAPVARAMAEGVRRVAGADLGLAVTGIAGPGGGTEAKPVGTVFLAVAWEQGAEVVERHQRWDRATFKQVTSQQALELVRRHLLRLPLNEKPPQAA